MLTWFAQELFSSCVAACVRMALNGLGDNRDEAQVRQLIGHARSGVSLVAAQSRLAEAGATAEWHAMSLRRCGFHRSLGTGGPRSLVD